VADLFTPMLNRKCTSEQSSFRPRRIGELLDGGELVDQARRRVVAAAEANSTIAEENRREGAPGAAPRIRTPPRRGKERADGEGTDYPPMWAALLDGRGRPRSEYKFKRMMKVPRRPSMLC